MKYERLLLALVVMTVHATKSAETTDVYIQAKAVTESGSVLAIGTYNVLVNGEPRQTDLPSTRGSSSEPVAMYMLLSYLAAPTPFLLNTPLAQQGKISGKITDQLIEEIGDWGARARTTLAHSEKIAVPAGTFSNVLEFKTVVADARCNPTNGATFVNGTRYLWLAKGIGLVRMRYEHSDGVITEAVLLSHSVAGMGDDFLPLQVGNRWTYAWKNGYRQEAVIETWKVGRQREDLEDSARKQSADKGDIKKVDPRTVTLDRSQDTWMKIPADAAKGFHFPYYLFVPKNLDSTIDRHLFVEPNNTGTASDDFEIHDRAAARLLLSSHATRIARELGWPLLVPVFPRPAEQWQAYTHSLDEDTLLIASGPLKRIDLQLIEMIRDARGLLRRNALNLQDKVFLHGYSASGVFVNRFAVLHPDVVRAVAAGGVNAIPILPAAEWHGKALPFPVGIGDLKQVAGIEFDKNAYRQVSQYIYMGYLDRNDTTLSRDAFSEAHAKLIRELIGAEMPKRWAVSQSIYRECGAAAQCVTYNGSGHEIKPEMITDIIEFFRANSNGGFVPIQPHEYPFVEFKEIKTAHINGVYWQGDERIPAGIRDLFGDKNQFIISIKEWMEGQDHQQLNSFREKAAFRFLLRAPGQEQVLITGDYLRGNCSSGRGEFQGFVVSLPPSELGKLARGVRYSLVPLDQREEYFWQVQEGAHLVRP